MKSPLLILAALVSFIFSCQETEEVDPSVDVDKDTSTFVETQLLNDKSLFELNLSLEKITTKEFNLTVDLDICEGCHFASYKSKENLRGAFSIELDGVNRIVSGSEYHENPSSTSSIDPFSNQEVYLITERTIISQQLHVIDTNDFQVQGAVSFVIEPACNRYKTEFVINQAEGRLEIIEGETYIDNFE